jgi:lipopolysaccharide export system permease protein
MKILDRYILLAFLRTFVFVVFILTTIIMVIDLVEKNGDFLKTKPGWDKIVFEYMANFIPYIANMLSPITVFIATVYITARLAGRTEIIAMLSTGMSFMRLLVPYLMGATIIGGSIYYINGWVIPKSNKIRVAFENKYLKNPFFFDGRNVHLKIAPYTFAYLESYNNTNQTGYQFTLEHIKGTDLHSKLKAARILWLPESGKWRLEDYSIRNMRDSVHTLQFGQTLDTTINLLPKDFESTYLLYETFTTTELLAYIEELKQKGADDIETYLVEKYLRITYPFAIIILTMIGVILSARKSREGTGFQIAVGFFLAFVYIIFYITSRTIAQAGSMDPLLACWLPNIVFACIGIVLYKTIPR